MLQSLELSGFKSFARKSSLSFTSAITGIVGPNGSGKSNVAEAFQFVLGEQSLKSLRGKRGEDMIWNGGGGQVSDGRANRASVKLVFDNSRRIFPGIDFEEVAVERVVNRDNSNEYIVNGSRVRLKDMIELLSGAHIGATGHHIISQGEADRILSASIRERREIIEDALGLKIYQWKKLESIRKLEKTDENMKQVESLRREIAPHIRFLKKQVEKVEKAEEMRKELIGVYKEYFAIEEDYIKTEKERLEGALSEPSKELSVLDRALMKAKETLSVSKSKDKKSDSIVALEARLADIRLGKDTIVRDLGRIEGEIAANKRAIEKEELRMKNEESRTVYLKDVEEVVRNVGSFKTDTWKTIEDAKRTFTEIIGTLKNFITGHKSTGDSVSLEETRAEIAKFAKEKSGLEPKLEDLNEDESKLTKEYGSLKRAIEEEKDTNREAEKDVFRIIARQQELRGVVTELTNQLNVVLRDDEDFRRELGEAGLIAGKEAVNYESLKAAVEGSSGNTSRFSQESRRKQIEKLKIRLEDAGAGGGAEVMKEYHETEERDAFLAKELLDLEKAKQELLKLIAELDSRIDYEFKSGILKINAEFQKFFSLMFGGGKAELSVVKEVRRKKRGELDELGDMLNGDDDSRSMIHDTRMSGGAETIRGSSLVNRDSETEEGPEGLEVNVSLPRKKVKGLLMLSGGERSLTSIALLFAISQVNPPPFIVLDETDAALDEANSKKYGDMIEGLSKQSQLILITHNRETMSRAGVLYGVTMGSDGASKLLSIAFEEAVKVAK